MCGWLSVCDRQDWTVACVPLRPLFAMSPTADKARGAIIIHTELYK